MNIHVIYEYPFFLEVITFLKNTEQVVTNNIVSPLYLYFLYASLWERGIAFSSCIHLHPEKQIGN